MSAALARPMHEHRRIRVRVWELPVRICHWLIVLSIIVLAATGLFIAHPFAIVSVAGPARNHFLMGWTKVIHFYAAIVFTVSVLSRIAWMFRGNRYARWNQFIPTTTARFRNAREDLKFYLFLRSNPPPTVGHTTLAGLSYAFVYGLCLVMICTGLALYAPMAPVGSPMRWFHFLIPVFGGLQTARLIHHIAMWLLIAFVIMHVYISILISAVEHNATLESIISGNKFIEPKTLTDAADQTPGEDRA